MDPVEKMLIEKYGVNPQEARVMAFDMQHGAFTQGENAGVYKDAKEEAYTDVANVEIQRMGDMAKKARSFVTIHDKMAKGDTLTPAEQDWYEQVKQINRKRYVGAAGKADTERTMGFVRRDVRAQMAAERVPEQLGRINTNVDTALATQQTGRDHLVQQLIPGPQSPMDPMIAAYMARFGGK